MHPIAIAWGRTLCLILVLNVVIQFRPSDPVLLTFMVPMGLLSLWWFAKAIVRPTPNDRHLFGRFGQ